VFLSFVIEKYIKNNHYLYGMREFHF
jgi:hypothetical protein